MENVLSSIQKWYVEQCDGNWEHSYSIKIESLDNPGWYIAIDLMDSSAELAKDTIINSEIDDNNWYNIQIKNGQYIASGDPMKLFFLLEKFKELVIEGSNKLEAST